MRKPRTWFMLGVLALAPLGMSVIAALAQTGATGAAPATQPATQPSAQDVINEMLNKRKENPLIEPNRAATVKPVTTSAPRMDPALQGVAPGMEPPKLRREGEFVVSRRGRLVHANGGTQCVFVFDSDGQLSPEPPMFLLPCLMLQEGEATVAERGDKVVFKLSGQVFEYKGANYLLPTMMMLAPDQDNLKH
jgi:hypothetical protein